MFERNETMDFGEGMAVLEGLAEGRGEELLHPPGHAPARQPASTQELRPEALLIDTDGDLGDVRTLLEECGIDLSCLEGDAHRRGWRQPSRVLIVSGSCALSLGRPVVQEEGDFTKIAVCGGASKTLRSRLELMGFDYLVQRPFQPAALRLLVRSALHHGADRRSEARLPVGWDVSWSAGWRSRTAPLLEISGSGCSLEVARYVEPGLRIRLKVPADVAENEAFTLRGRVLRYAQKPGLRTGAATLVFEQVDPRTRARLAALLKGLHGFLPVLPD